MVAIKIQNFGGEIPALDDRLLPDNQAAASVNTWLFSGRVEPVHSLVPLHTRVNSAALSWFRVPKGNPGIDNMVDSYWLEFANANVRVIRSPVSGQDDNGRYYWADGVQPMMMTGDMVAAGSSPYILGVPAPSIAPGVTSSGGVSATNKTVSYVYTWVSSLGEESAPSPPTTFTGRIDDTYNLVLTAPGTGVTTNRNLTLTRIYRTVVSAQGIATFYFVAEIAITTLAFADGFSDAVVVLNEQLQTTFWTPPPGDLQGLVSLPNGMVASWRFNEVWFCEPYHPHAWPVPYVIAVPNNIVGLGVFGQSVIILTEGQPWAATGVDPSSMALAAIQPLEPCTSRNSIVNTPNGVLYSSPNGLIMITPNGAENMTLNTITKDEWNKVLNLPTINAAVLALGYYAFSGQISGVFQADSFQTDSFQQESHFGTKTGAYIKLDIQRIGMTVLDLSPSEVQNVITDTFNGEVTIMKDGVIYVVDLRSESPYGKYRWRSKIFSLNYLMNLAAAKVFWTPAEAPDLPPTVFRMYAAGYANLSNDGLPLKFERVLPTSGVMMRLPSGYKALFYQFEVEGYVEIDSIHVAQSARELRAI